jgi:hypothetical protein
MGRLRLAWAISVAGIAVNTVGVYLLIGLAYSLLVVGAEILVAGIALANLGVET